MALRVSKAVLVLAIALFYTILVLNNLTDYGSTGPAPKFTLDIAR
jgi:predicted small integral membrane protein